MIQHGREDGKILWNTAFFVVGYAVFFFALQYFLRRLGMVGNEPHAHNIAAWDAGWYRRIAEQGYNYDENGQSSAGFYYLFPLLWKVSHVGAWGISLINIILFGLGMGIFSMLYKLSMTERILLITMPQMVIAFVPYSEALFFFLVSLSFLAVHKRIRWLTWVSLFLLSLTRATTITLIPAFLVMELVANDRRVWYKSLLRYSTDHLLPMLAGLGVFVLVQYAYTGVWFAYFKSQSNFWMRKYGVPVFPLYGSDNNTYWLNAMALFVCALAALLAIWYGIRWLVKNVQVERELMLSITYLAINLYMSLYYSPKWIKDTTDIIGTFRYTLLTPFFCRFLMYMIKDRRYQWYNYLLVVALASGAWMAFGAYLHIQHFLFFTGNTVIVVLYMLHSDKRLQWPALVMACLNFFFQVFFFQKFISLTVLLD